MHLLLTVQIVLKLLVLVQVEIKPCEHVIETDVAYLLPLLVDRSQMVEPRYAVVLRRVQPHQVVEKVEVSSAQLDCLHDVWWQIMKLLRDSQFTSCALLPCRDGFLQGFPTILRQVQQLLLLKTNLIPKKHTLDLIRILKALVKSGKLGEHREDEVAQVNHFFMLYLCSRRAKIVLRLYS